MSEPTTPDWSQFYTELEDRAKPKVVGVDWAEPEPEPEPEPTAPPRSPPYPWCYHPGTCTPLGYCPRAVSCGD